MRINAPVEVPAIKARFWARLWGYKARLLLYQSKIEIQKIGSWGLKSASNIPSYTGFRPSFGFVWSGISVLVRAEKRNLSPSRKNIGTNFINVDFLKNPPFK
jgi:hypothetical protein